MLGVTELLFLRLMPSVMADRTARAEIRHALNEKPCPSASEIHFAHLEASMRFFCIFLFGFSVSLSPLSLTD